TLSRTSCAATSGSFSSRKLTITCETPSDEIERSSSMPLIVLTASSILSLTSVSICSGAAPGWIVVMTTVGKSTLGKRSTPSLVNEKAPITVSERMRTVAKTGRLTQSSANHCISHLAGPKGPGLRTFQILHSQFLIAAFHPGSVGELRDVLGRDPLAGLQALRNFHEIADRVAGGDDSLLDVIAGDDVDAAGARAHLDGGGRHENRRRLRRLLDARGREETRLQHAAAVRHGRFNRERALLGLQSGRHVLDRSLELAAGIRVHLEVHRLAGSHRRDSLLRHGQLHAQRVHAHHDRDLHP